MSNFTIESDTRPYLKAGAPKLNVLVLDDSAVDLRHIETDLLKIESIDCKVWLCLNLADMAEMADGARNQAFDLILLDDRLGPATRAEQAWRVINSHWAGVPVVVITGAITPRRQTELLELGCTEIATKDELDVETLTLLLTTLALPR